MIDKEKLRYDLAMHATAALLINKNERVKELRNKL